MGADKNVRSFKISQLAGGKVAWGPSLLTPSCIVLHNTEAVKVLPENLTQAGKRRILLATGSQKKGFFTFREINLFTILYILYFTILYLEFKYALAGCSVG